ncbi:hypothetical protein CCR95_22300 [Thiocystis minor]|uniref:hypothetical protein n=1 Tax=Thiocystis minor TaxID=61597 RepID=UPI0019125602|nr:hypothetical protein [Thiocystis minor]MBK5966731.1 hypothetical protein [Thiocystis minor]
MTAQHETVALSPGSGQVANIADTPPAASSTHATRPRSAVFQPGAVVGGVTILARLPHGYRVRYRCCDTLATLSSSQLKARRARPETQCHACAAQASIPTRTFRHNDELPVHPRTLAPSAAFLLGIQARATAIVRQRHGT